MPNDPSRTLAPREENNDNLSRTPGSSEENNDDPSIFPAEREENDDYFFEQAGEVTKRILDLSDRAERPPIFHKLEVQFRFGERSEPKIFGPEFEIGAVVNLKGSGSVDTNSRFKVTASSSGQDSWRYQLEALDNQLSNNYEWYEEGRLTLARF